MISTPQTPLPTSPDALRDLVLSLLQQQEEQEAERARYIAVWIRDDSIGPAPMPVP